MADFPVEVFELSGEPAAIRASAVPYREFHDEAVRAAAQIRGLDTSLFVGPEGDEYREGLSQELPPHLQQAGEAFGLVATALTGFADDLDGLQERMSPLRVRAPHLWQDLQSALGQVAAAEAADQQHQVQQWAAQAVFLPGQVASDQSQTPAASAGLDAAQRAWQQCLDTATQIQSELEAAVERCERQIREASGMRFHKNPSGLGAVTAGVSDFVKDHAAGLAQLSGALKTVSAITGMASFIPGIGEITLAISIATGAAAMAIDATTMSATGKWDPAVLAVDGVVLLPVAGKIASKGFDAAEASREAAALKKPPTKLNPLDKPAPRAETGSDPLSSPATEASGDAAYHYTFARYADSIAENGLRPGSYATPEGSLSGLQAQLDLALPPNRGLPEVKIRADLAGLRKAGYEIPHVTRVSSTVTGAGGRVYTMPGGGYEIQFPYAIPAEFLKVAP